MENSTPDQVAGFIERARHERRSGAHMAALAAFEAAAAVAPDNDGVQVEIAVELRALDRLGDARQRLDGVLARAPHFTNALIELGHLCRRQNDPRGALAAFEGAAANHPEHLGLQLEIVRSLRDLDRLDDAEARLSRALGAHPRNLACLIEKAHLSRRRGDHAAALSAFREAAAVDKDHAGLKLEIARTLRALGDGREAEKMLRRMLRANPVDTAALVTLARALADDGRADEAVALLDKAPSALARDSNVARAGVYVARKSGDGDAALRFLERAVTLDPGNFDLALDLAAEQRRRASGAGARAHASG
jgi:tetratricopeptide (TPR) repeat protein